MNKEYLIDNSFPSHESVEFSNTTKKKKKFHRNQSYSANKSGKKCKRTYSGAQHFPEFKDTVDTTTTLNFP